MEALVLGNATLDILCYPVEDVPRHDSISFQRSIVSPGGCGSNVAIGLAALGVPAGLIATIGDDDAATLLEAYWDRVGLDRRFVRRLPGQHTGVSVGLIDTLMQPRFVHTSGANAYLNASAVDLDQVCRIGCRNLHVAGYFVLPGLLDGHFKLKLAEAQKRGLETSLDVVHSPRMDDPFFLWGVLPYLDFFFCNRVEAKRLTGIPDPVESARFFRSRGAAAVLVKLGSEGCLVDSDEFQGRVPGEVANVVDTTGAGDAFAAGFIAARVKEMGVEDACRAGNAAGARVVSALGAVSAWVQDS